MPIPSVDYFPVMISEELNVLVYDGDDFVAVGDREGAAWAEVVLDVYDDEGGVGVDCYRQFSCRVRGLLSER